MIEISQCSEATARRDLEILEKSGELIRTIGGAIYEGSVTFPGREASFSEKRLVHWKEKERIASAAAGLVEEGDVIGLTGGTTTFLIAKALKSRKNITVVTNAVNIAMEFVDSEDIQVVLTGGVLRNKSYELCGPLSEKMIEGLNITKMFLGVDGVTQEHGFTTYSELEARINQLLIRRSGKVYAALDRSKVGKSSLFTIIPFHQVMGIVIEDSPEDWFVEACETNGINIYLPH